MNREEIKKILELLEKGVISSEEALDLIQALDNSDKTNANKKYSNNKKEDLESLVNRVVESAREISRKGQEFIDGLEFPEFTKSSKFKNKETELETLEQLEGLESLKVEINHGNLKVRNSKDHQFKIQSEIFYTDSLKEVVTLHEYEIKDNLLEINSSIDDKILPYSHVNYTIFIPKSLKDLSIKSINSSLFVADCELESLHLESVNGRLSIKDSKINKVFGETVNGTIILENNEAENLQGKSVNGDIIAQNLTVSEYNLSSVHGELKIKGTVFS